MWLKKNSPNAKKYVFELNPIVLLTCPENNYQIIFSAFLSIERRTQNPNSSRAFS